ncbi:hypothetical protein [uncultured Thiohalocapsa sp.]|uniref:hypothetical protein n=1 Tax=uncultured Thiohalocapsa sp. TaxID=768990 RepID=UPI0025E75F2A|nr:hypothetical protein [uncultured Thiohalocapsa sp.]
MLTRLIAAAGLALIAILPSACQSPRDAARAEPLAGTWILTQDGAEQARLVIGADGRFHVDLLRESGIEAEGDVQIDGDRVTFINTRGTDPIASDPAPGTYTFVIAHNQVRFERVADSISRRARLLSRPWSRAD